MVLALERSWGFNVSLGFEREENELGFGTVEGVRVRKAFRLQPKVEMKN